MQPESRDAPSAMVSPLLPSATSDGIRQDPDVWFEDGNIVVVAQQTAFRFHRGALARQSETFRDLFAIPQPASPNADEMLDGCPIVHVSDTAYDFKHLLCALYDGVSYFASDKPMQFSVLAALVRLGHKYQVNAIFDESVRRLKPVFPSDFESWMKLQSPNMADVILRKEESIEAFNLFALIGQTKMMATALYRCCSLPMHQIIRGVARADGTIETFSSPNLERCLKAHANLIKIDAQLASQFFHLDPPSDCVCISVIGRRETLEDLERDHFCDSLDVVDAQPFGDAYFGKRIQLEAGQGRICQPCADAMAAGHLENQKQLWCAMPYILGFESGEIEGWEGWESL